MKRPLIVALIIGSIAAAIICLLQATGLLFLAERAIDGFASRHATLTRQIAAPWQYVFVTLLCFGVAWVTLASRRIGWARWVFAILFIELIAVPWVCALYHVFFQPLPSLLAARSVLVWRLAFESWAAAVAPAGPKKYSQPMYHRNNSIG